MRRRRRRHLAALLPSFHCSVSSSTDAAHRFHVADIRSPGRDPVETLRGRAATFPTIIARATRMNVRDTTVAFTTTDTPDDILAVHSMHWRFKLRGDNFTPHAASPYDACATRISCSFLARPLAPSAFNFIFNDSAVRLCFRFSYRFVYALYVRFVSGTLTLQREIKLFIDSVLRKIRIYYVPQLIYFHLLHASLKLLEINFVKQNGIKVKNRYR